MATDTPRTAQSRIKIHPVPISIPQVSIGMPVYNGEFSIRQALDSLLSQSFRDFELIISDNASTDGTEEICRKYAAQDVRIRYLRQNKNLGPLLNFMIVLNEAVGEYFMWSAADDRRTQRFLDANVCALQSFPSISASTSPNCYEGEESDLSKHVNFSLLGSYAERYIEFLSNAWRSHGIFYSLMRTKVIRRFEFPESDQIAFDWMINIYLLSNGGIYRANEGLIIIGRNGQSNQKNPWKTFQNEPIEHILPLYKFSRYAYSFLRGLGLREMLICYFKLAKLNIQATISRFKLH